MPRNRMFKHGLTHSKTYEAWRSMRRRCDDPRVAMYPYYGGRGIGYDPRWADFMEFFIDMGEAPEGTSLDRVDNDDGYSASNCRWATGVQQANNKRSNRVIECGGLYATKAEWARYLGIPYGALQGRIRLGWPIERALTERPRSHFSRA